MYHRRRHLGHSSYRDQPGYAACHPCSLAATRTGVTVNHGSVVVAMHPAKPPAECCVRNVVSQAEVSRLRRRRSWYGISNARTAWCASEVCQSTTRESRSGFECKSRLMIHRDNEPCHVQPLRTWHNILVSRAGRSMDTWACVDEYVQLLVITPHSRVICRAALACEFSRPGNQ